MNFFPIVIWGQIACCQTTRKLRLVRQRYCIYERLLVWTLGRCMVSFALHSWFSALYWMAGERHIIWRERRDWFCMWLFEAPRIFSSRYPELTLSPATSDVFLRLFWPIIYFLHPYPSFSSIWLGVIFSLAYLNRGRSEGIRIWSGVFMPCSVGDTIMSWWGAELTTL